MNTKYIQGHMHQYEWYPKQLPDLYIQRIEDDGSTTCIPPIEDNYDYRMFQQWIAEGNTPDEYVPPIAIEES